MTLNANRTRDLQFDGARTESSLSFEASIMTAHEKALLATNQLPPWR